MPATVVINPGTTIETCQLCATDANRSTKTNIPTPTNWWNLKYFTDATPSSDEGLTAQFLPTERGDFEILFTAIP